ncbi:MAG: hypothetical protein K6E73_10630 [Bacteroidales bacterium]|nr:hypothetical protein [Bacteroidales bacterium]
MKKYIGKKTIMAEPMAKSEAEKVLNRSLADAKGGEEGYLVEYEDGYKSWSPQEAFEKAYRVAETYQDRLKIEADELRERIMRLFEFRLSDEFFGLSLKNQELLEEQSKMMKTYYSILRLRIRLNREQSK